MISQSQLNVLDMCIDRYGTVYVHVYKHLRRISQEKTCVLKNWKKKVNQSVNAIGLYVYL